VDKYIEQGPKQYMANPTCEDCNKRLVGRYLRWKDEHPLDTPSLQKTFGPILKKLEDFEKTCPIPDSFKVDSEGHKLTNGINTFLGVGVVGLTFAVFM
jgi:hypothetical protein